MSRASGGVISARGIHSRAKAYACAGVVSIPPDYRWERPRAWYAQVDDFANPDLDRKTSIATVVEMRRAINLLLSRPSIDPNRVGYVGHSFGAQWGAILSSVDRRIKTAVLMAGVAEEADVLLRSDNPRLQDLRASLPENQLQTYVSALQDLNAIDYVRHAGPTASMDRYAAAASEPKTVFFYDCAHDLNDPQAFRDRSNWLKEHLGLR